MINAKYHVRDVAKDLDVKTNYVTELIEKNFGGAKKSSMTALESDELDLLFDTVTKENAVDSFDEYFALKSKKEAPQRRRLRQPSRRASRRKLRRSPHRSLLPQRIQSPPPRPRNPPQRRRSRRRSRQRTDPKRRTITSRCSRAQRASAEPLIREPAMSSSTSTTSAMRI